MKEATRQKGTITNSVRQMFVASPGVELHIDSISRDTGLTRKQVMNAIGSLRYGSINRSRMNIVPVIAGQVYRYDGVLADAAGKPVEKPAEKPAEPTAADSSDVMVVRVVGQAGDHQVLLDTVTGCLWKAEVIWRP